MKTLVNIILMLLLAGACPEAFSQGNCMDVGTNFHFFDAGVYKDMKLSSTPFFTRNHTYIGDGNDWDSGLAGTMDQDDAGYPLEVPFVHPVTGIDQIVAFTIGGYSLNYETGNYVLLHEGTGSFNFAGWTAATVTSVAPGRIEFSIDSVNENGVHIEITASSAGDHIRNIRVIRDVYESDFQVQPFLPQFEQKADEFSLFRLMDWTFTNGHPVSQWASRTLPGFHTQNVEPEGVAWEHIIDMCNHFRKDAWINVPHLADQIYIDSMAMLFRDQLDPDLDIYLEYSNECWNWIFEQTYWLDSVGPYPGQGGRNYGHYALEVFERWDHAFAGQEARLKTVLAGHDYFVLDALDVFSNQNQLDRVDLVSYPGYIALNEANYDTLSHYGAAATGQMVIDMLRANMEGDMFWMKQFKSLVADPYGKEFVMYEGGQHITPQWFGLDTSYNQALYDAQVHPGMYDFYTDILDFYRDSLEVTLFVNYVLASPQETPFGSWGLLDNYFENAPFPPKWNAVTDWMDAHPCGQMVSVEDPFPSESSASLTAYPNPATDFISLDLDSNQVQGPVTLLDLNGRVVLHANGITRIPIHSLSPGMYLIRVNTAKGELTSRFLKGGNGG